MKDLGQVQVGMLTEQQVFDKVLRHLLKQGHRAVLAATAASANEVCAYRAPDGGKCAAGCLIEDRFYEPSFEGRSASYDPVVGALLKSGVPRSALELVYQLQSAHDAVLKHGVEPWLERMRQIAQHHGLEWKEQ